MTRITIDSAQSSKLREAVEPVELRDPSGKLLGQFVPRFDPSEWEIVGPERSDEELDRIANSNEKRYTTEEVLAHLHGLENQ